MTAAAALFGDWCTLPDSPDQRVARLTRGQIDCLALVFQHHNSKEIAALLGISPHTVDQRIRQALHVLGVERRAEAARLVAAAGLAQPTYQRLIHQPPHLDETPAPDHQAGAVSHQIRHADRAGGTGSFGVITEQAPTERRLSLPLPFATRSKPRNEMGVGLRLLWIVTIAMGSIFSAGMYLAGLESLSRMLGS